MSQLEYPHSDEFVDIGNGHGVRLVVEGEDVLGVWVRHECAAKPWHNDAGAFIPLRGASAWKLVSRDPLTVEPSIHFIDCGDHGFIRDGKWVPA